MFLYGTKFTPVSQKVEGGQWCYCQKVALTSIGVATVQQCHLWFCFSFHPPAILDWQKSACVAYRCQSYIKVGAHHWKNSYLRGIQTMVYWPALALWVLRFGPLAMHNWAALPGNHAEVSCWPLPMVLPCRDKLWNFSWWPCPSPWNGSRLSKHPSDPNGLNYRPPPF